MVEVVLALTAAAGLAAAPLAQDYTIVFHNPDSEYYVAGVGFTRLSENTLVAIVPVIPRSAWNLERRAERSVSHIVASRDGGRTWEPLARLPFYSATPWVHGGKLFLFAHKGGREVRSRDVYLLNSADGGRTWSQPLLLFSGQYLNCDTAMVIRDNRLTWAVDDLGLDPQRGPRLIVGDLSRDPMERAAWRISEPLPYPGAPAELTVKAVGAKPSLYLEPNVVDVNGRLRVIATAYLQAQATAGLAAVFDVHEDGHTPRLEFAQYHPAPGGQLKRSIIWDAESRLFWATANLAADSQELRDWWEPARQSGRYTGGGGNDRRFLMLFYSVDALNWFQAGCIAQASRLSQAFMYARPVIDGADLAVLSRTSLNAPNQHDADYATFHRVRDFRRLAMNLVPEPEAPPTGGGSTRTTKN